MLPEAAAQLKRVPTSIDTLSPNDPFVPINTFPIVTSIPFHTIEGDRGRGGAPNSSDGRSAILESHVDGPRSELIVPSDHTTQSGRDCRSSTDIAVASLMKLRRSV